MTERTRRRVRAGLVYLAASFVVVGLWATLAPSSFYDGFPGGGRHWVAGEGPYNARLVGDDSVGFPLSVWSCSWPQCGRTSVLSRLRPWR